SDPMQPSWWVFHDNICAHEMSVVSMSSVLPRTPADINGLLSIVFVGPGKFKPDQFDPIFRVRKDIPGYSSCGRRITIGFILKYTLNEKMSSLSYPAESRRCDAWLI
ncbi:hypothetical protein F4604DRAFT_1570836, partial [Suillus subluteus]